MTKAEAVPYGGWKSPITSDLIVSETIRLGQIALDGNDTYWVESRPTEEGRNVIVRRSSNGEISDLTPPPYNARTRVHEYGGGAFVVAEGAIYFSNYRDQRLYRQTSGREPQPITPEARLRYADGVMDRRRNRLICVCEDHTAGDQEAVNSLIALRLDGRGRAGVLASGNDFYAYPRLSPDGRRLAWLTWNHPNMPWDGAELWVADIDEAGSLNRAMHVAGGLAESIFQPAWSPDGILYFVSDRTGWWNLYRWQSGNIEAVTQLEAEFGAPQWLFGTSTYAFESARHLICAYTRQGQWRLAMIDTRTKELQPLATPYTDIGNVQAVSGRAVFWAASPTELGAIVELQLDTNELTVLRRESKIVIDPGYLSPAEAIEFPTADGQTAYAFFYAPKNRDYVAPPGELPPLLVMSHGGPTGATDSSLSLEIQYWTSRGLAVLDVNYGGSTGYGRAYRQRLDGRWGIVDVDDCVNGACYLVEQGRVDGRRLAIRGGSAGGYTTLSALTFRDIFQAGASYYGVSDLEALARETHKFESRYLDRLIGPYPARRDIYQARSPIHAVDQLSCPLILFQGLEDEVVPPNQAEMIVEALRQRGIPVAYLPFEGEQHGFRRAKNIKRALDAELYFYARIFNFELADPVEPVMIENL
jgi:dipeptidyl aminopeptidase/acylaminoacyl peptidase